MFCSTMLLASILIAFEEGRHYLAVEAELRMSIVTAVLLFFCVSGLALWACVVIYDSGQTMLEKCVEFDI